MCLLWRGMTRRYRVKDMVRGNFISASHPNSPSRAGGFCRGNPWSRTILDAKRGACSPNYGVYLGCPDGHCCAKFVFHPRTAPSWRVQPHSFAEHFHALVPLYGDPRGKRSAHKCAPSVDAKSLCDGLVDHRSIHVPAGAHNAHGSVRRMIIHAKWGPSRSTLHRAGIDDKARLRYASRSTNNWP